MINQYKPQDFEETYVLTSPYLPIIHKKSLDFLEATHFIPDMIGNDKTDQDNFRKNIIILTFLVTLSLLQVKCDTMFLLSRISFPTMTRSGGNPVSVAG